MSTSIMWLFAALVIAAATFGDDKHPTGVG